MALVCYMRMGNGSEGLRFPTNLYLLESASWADAISMVTSPGGDHRTSRGAQKDGYFVPRFLIIMVRNWSANIVINDG
jgi:hypothetical protein